MKEPETEQPLSDMEARLKETKATLEEKTKADQQLIEAAFNDIGKALSGEAFQDASAEIQKLLVSSQAELEAKAKEAMQVAEATVRRIESAFEVQDASLTEAMSNASVEVEKQPGEARARGFAEVEKQLEAFKETLDSKAQSDARVVEEIFKEIDVRFEEVEGDLSTRANEKIAATLAETKQTLAGMAVEAAEFAEASLQEIEDALELQSVAGVGIRAREEIAKQVKAIEAAGKAIEDTAVAAVESEEAGRAASTLLGISGTVSGMLGVLPGGLLAKRTVEIWTFVAEIAAKSALAERSGDLARRQAVGEELCAGLLRLGPTFIKLGQILSTRFDILPYDYVKALEKLQDSVPGFDGDVAYRIVKEEVGEGAFRSFDKEPIAAASLGQVHLAVTSTGEQVAVKVQRPGLKALFDADLQNLKVLAEILYRVDKSPDSLLRDWREIFESNTRIIYEEIDYLKEANNALKFADNFAELDWVKVPGVRREFSSKRVLTMEYVPGTKISDVAAIRQMGLDPKELSRLSGESFMIQLLRHGFFHCDPHPGNIAVDIGPKGRGRLIYYDFGMMDELSESFRKALVDGFFALYEGDAKQIVDALIAGELLGGKVDRMAIDNIAGNFLSSFRERLALGTAEAMTEAERTQLRMNAMQEIGNELAAVASDRPFRYPRALPYVLRAFNALEGVGKSLDKNYDISRIAQKYITELIDLKDGSAAITAWKKLRLPERLGLRPKDLVSVVTAPRRVSQAYDTLVRLETGELQPRVRALEVERALIRSSVMQRASLFAIAASTALNLYTLLTVIPTTGLLPAFVRRMAFAVSAFFGAKSMVLLRQFRRLELAEKEGNLSEYLLESKRD